MSAKPDVAPQALNLGATTAIGPVCRAGLRHQLLPSRRCSSSREGFFDAGDRRIACAKVNLTKPSTTPTGVRGPTCAGPRDRRQFNATSSVNSLISSAASTGPVAPTMLTGKPPPSFCLRKIKKRTPSGDIASSRVHVELNRLRSLADGRFHLLVQMLDPCRGKFAGERETSPTPLHIQQIGREADLRRHEAHPDLDAPCPSGSRTVRAMGSKSSCERPSIQTCSIRTLPAGRMSGETRSMPSAKPPGCG